MENIFKTRPTREHMSMHEHQGQLFLWILLLKANILISDVTVPFRILPGNSLSVKEGNYSISSSESFPFFNFYHIDYSITKGPLWPYHIESMSPCSFSLKDLTVAQILSLLETNNNLFNLYDFINIGNTTKTIILPLCYMDTFLH